MAVPAGRLPARLPPDPNIRGVSRQRLPSSRRRRVPFLLFSLLVVAATVIGLVSAQALVAEESFRVTDLTAEAERLEADYGRLRLEVAELSSPERILATARRAGLVLPEEVEILPLPAVENETERSVGGTGAILALKGVLGGER
jgi:cell division protein FtsL